MQSRLLALLLACVFFFTVGEIYLSPIGLSFVSKIAPRKIVAMMMGIWLLSSFFGNYMAGYLGSYCERIGVERFFGLMIVLSLAASVILMLLASALRRTVHGLRRHGQALYRADSLPPASACRASQAANASRYCCSSC